MHNVGIIWQYAEQQDALPIRRASQNREEITGVASENYPLLGRKVELMIVASQILLLDEPLHRRRDLAAIVFEGESELPMSCACEHPLGESFAFVTVSLVVVSIWLR